MPFMTDYNLLEFQRNWSALIQPAISNAHRPTIFEQRPLIRLSRVRPPEGPHVSLALGFPPKLFKPLRATTGKLIEFVPDRIFLVEVLVILFGGIERGRCNDLGSDRLFELLRL